MSGQVQTAPGPGLEELTVVVSPGFLMLGSDPRHELRELWGLGRWVAHVEPREAGSVMRFCPTPMPDDLTGGYPEDPPQRVVHPRCTRSERHG